MAKGIYVASSFGARHTTFGPPGFSALGFIDSERIKCLARRESYFRATQHDWKMFDFDGRMIAPGPPTSQPLLSAEAPAYYVPLKIRRPSAPVRLGRLIVNKFTTLLFGYGRWPTIRVHGDPMTEMFNQQLAKAAKLRTHMIRARNIGGSTGTVGLSWRYYEGKPLVAVHNPKRLHVHEWCDRESLIPAHVSEIYTFEQPVFDPRLKRVKPTWFWFRRDWTEAGDLVFKPVEYKPDADPTWVVDEERSVLHGDGVCHFVWIQNLPDDDGTSIDGQPDYAELYEEMDEIDIVRSVVSRGAKLNLDPTLVLKMDPDIVERTGIAKGSDNAIVAGETGDAHYMELGGSSLTAGADLVTRMRESILENAQCVIPDPNEVGGAGTSSIALKVIHEPSLSKAEVYREQYGEGLKRLLGQMDAVARERTTTTVSVPVVDEATGEPVVDEAGAPVQEEAEAYIDLPPVRKVVRNEAVDEWGEPTGVIEETIEEVEVHPGEGGDLELDWGDYFSPTPDDKQKAVMTLQLATIAKIMSIESAAEEVARMYERDRKEELERIRSQEDGEKVADEGIFNEDVGGEVEERDALPEGASPREEVIVEVDDKEAIKYLTVNEVRTSRGQGPLLTADGRPDPDGDLTTVRYEAKMKSLGTEAGKQVGVVEGQVEATEVAAASPTAVAAPGGQAPSPGGGVGESPPIETAPAEGQETGQGVVQVHDPAGDRAKE